jgi:hypothetical protein
LRVSVLALDCGGEASTVHVITSNSYIFPDSLAMACRKDELGMDQ